MQFVCLQLLTSLDVILHSSLWYVYHIDSGEVRHVAWRESNMHETRAFTRAPNIKALLDKHQRTSRA